MRLMKINFIACLLILLAASAFAQTGAGVDAAFAPELTSQSSIPSLRLLLQPDGKLLLSSPQIPNRIARLNTDGSRDTGFNCSACGSLTVNKIALQPDGKILAAGTDSVTNLPKIIRINADGSLDASFSASITLLAGYTGSLTVYDVQADGKIYVGLTQTSSNASNITVYRLNADGSTDSGFTPIVNNTTQPTSTLVNVKVLSDGRVFIFGNTTYGSIAQLNNDGSKNLAFESPVLTNNGLPPNGGHIYDITLQADGKIGISGVFYTVNGQGRLSVARLNTDGTVDLGFSPILFTGFESFRVAPTIDAVPGGKLIVTSNSTNRKIVRLNADGSNDTSYTPPTNITSTGDLVVDALGQAYVFATFVTNFTNYSTKLVRLTTTGSIDTGYVADPGAVGGITALAVQTDGKILVGGTFDKANGVARNTITRLNADGTTDASFNAGTGFNSQIKDIAVQPNGKVIVLGDFSAVNGVGRRQSTRLNSDGSVDTTFNLTSQSGSIEFNSVVILSDGKFLIGGQFGELNSTFHSLIARFNVDGSIDSTFNPLFDTSGNSRVRNLLVQGDGKIMAVGEFNGVNGVNRTNIVRLNADGTTDTSFNAAVTAGPLQILQQPDGKYLIRTNVNIYRLNANGTQDNSFAFAGVNAFYLATMSLQPNGAIVIGGSFSSINNQPRRNIARLLPNGNLDVLYFPRNTDNTVLTSITQADGKVIIGGVFTNIGGVTRFGIARLAASPLTLSSKFDFDGDGKADVSVFRPENGFWYVQGSQSGFTGAQFGASTDKLAPADYDGDGKTDIAVFRDGNWYLQRSSNGFVGATFGQTGDIPQPADMDGDGRAELVFWRPSNGTWYVWNLFNDQRRTVQFGAATDKPVIGDYDGDGKADYAVVRPSGGASSWYILGSTQGFYGLQFGTDTDKPVPADYDGDGKTDVAVFRPSTGTWYLQRSTAGFTGVQFGIATDLPVAADYDGDGKADIAVFRDGNWYLNRSTAGFTGLGFGAATDKPVPNSFVP